ncbi:DUF4376 domain-containing protein [Chromobacterium sp. S0633]|uniref:DUF4376 domain-containing protein n=1 Tax=Chromobacterium sp. S0633 TaxID=2957805 RepID=UPI0020A10180|nr:DUF4376 domain-containing protein [Chromobacterium sp. S0633]MCP1290752.1 DUF4376 domain-containing protein [Chromobacterium sp. S0633]
MTTPKYYAYADNGVYTYPIDYAAGQTTTIAPPAKLVVDHVARIIEAGKPDSGWQAVRDWRGETLYSTEDGAEQHIDERGSGIAGWNGLGNVPSGYTELQRPSIYHRWDGETWTLDGPGRSAQLLAARAAAYARITAERDRLEAAGFPYLGKVFDSDPRSVQRITSAALAAQSAKAIGVPFEISWDAADNSVMKLDADGALGLPIALATYVAGLYTTARELKALIDQAATVETAEAIRWPTM